MKTLLLLLLPFTAFGQINWKAEIAPCAALIFAGAADGTAESVKWHYHEQFSTTVPGNDPDYWNPDISWKNKYRDGTPESGPAYFGSTTFLAWTTDGYHLMRTTRNLMVTTAILLAPKQKQKWHSYLIKAAMYTLSYQLGFHLTYTFIFKP